MTDAVTSPVDDCVVVRCVAAWLAASRYAGKVVNASTLGVVAGNAAGDHYDFGTRTSRGGWDRRNLATPFTDSDHVLNPGPGSYMSDVSFFGNGSAGGSMAPDAANLSASIRVVNGKLQRVDGKASAPFSTSSESHVVVVFYPSGFAIVGAGVVMCLQHNETACETQKATSHG